MRAPNALKGSTRPPAEPQWRARAPGGFASRRALPISPKSGPFVAWRAQNVRASRNGRQETRNGRAWPVQDTARVRRPPMRNVDPPGNDHQRGGSRGEHERARRFVRSARRPRATPSASPVRPLARPREICRARAAIISENEPNRDHSLGGRPPAAIAEACSAVADGWEAYGARKRVALKYNAAQPVSTSH